MSESLYFLYSLGVINCENPNFTCTKILSSFSNFLKVFYQCEELSPSAELWNTLQEVRCVCCMQYIFRNQGKSMSSWIFAVHRFCSGLIKYQTGVPFFKHWSCKNWLVLNGYAKRNKILTLATKPALLKALNTSTGRKKCYVNIKAICFFFIKEITRELFNNDLT